MEGNSNDVSDHIQYLRTIVSVADESIESGNTPEVSYDNWVALRNSLKAQLDLINEPGSIGQRMLEVEKERDTMREMLAMANMKLDKQVEELSLLRVMADVVSHTLLLDSPLQFLVQQIVTVADAENGSIMLVDKENERLVLKAAAGTKDISPREVSFDLGEGIAGSVATSGRSKLIDDALKEPVYRTIGHCDEVITSILCLPLIHKREVLGVINLSSSRTKAFHKDTERFLKAVTGLVSLYIYNTQNKADEQE